MNRHLLEVANLIELLMENAADQSSATLKVAARIANATQQQGHLWEAMQLDNREEFETLLQAHFPDIAKSNSQQVRWKKWIYQHLAARTGQQLTPPLCHQCFDYEHCYPAGPINSTRH